VDVKDNLKFSSWVKWSDRNTLNQLEFPGVYVIALADSDIGTAFSWRPEVIYIGMTNAKGGLKSRLNQFDSTIQDRTNTHNPAKRFRSKYPDYELKKSKLYVSVFPRKCNVESKLPADLRIMGEVTRNEYECFALFVEAFGKLPEFNNRLRPPRME
jgi:hypothetical protein